ncbi:growth/differentiation factor 3 [Thomomys bottae]
MSPLLPLLALHFLCMATGGRTLRFHQKDFLQFLDLDKESSPRSSLIVPSVMERTFQNWETAGNTGNSQELCYVKELGIPGNVLRLLPDQGIFLPPREHTQDGLCLRKRLHFTLPDIQAIKGWHRNIQKNLTFFLDVRTPPKRDSGVHFPQEALCGQLRRSLQASLLVVTLRPEQCRPPSRIKRAAILVPDVTRKDFCHRHQLYIHFQVLGWHRWIIAPKGFMANYCQGQCPLALTMDLNSSNYAFMQACMQTVDPRVPQAACVPTKLSPISLLYHDRDSSVVLRNFEDMVVDECGCG